MEEDVKGELKSLPKKRPKSKDPLAREIDYKVDSSYKFQEVALENSDLPLSYTPTYFLRTHSKNNDPADVQTQVWQCAFEPNAEKFGYHTDTIATCGGSSVCFIDVNDGEVMLKYNRNTKVTFIENLYALAWSSIPLDKLGLKKLNVIAAAGTRTLIVLMHPDAGYCYQMFRTVSNRGNAVVNSLLFHPKKATWLFCGHDDGHVQLWDIDIPKTTSYKSTPVHIMTIPASAGDAYNMAFSQKLDLLICGCDRGLVAWNIEMSKVKNSERLDRIDFILPDAEERGSVVDSIALLRDDVLAVKCSCILACGDDKGTVWVYELLSYVNGSVPCPLMGNAPLKKSVSPDLKLEWPELDDPEVEKARKLHLKTHDIVIDKCAVSDGGRHIVAVTSTNMVCIWKRESQSSREEDKKATEK